MTPILAEQSQPTDKTQRIQGQTSAQADRPVEEILNRVTEVGAVGDVRGGPALLVAADHADDLPSAGGGPEPGHPRAAAGAALVAVAREPQLGAAVGARLVGAGDGLVVLVRVAGHLDDAVERRVEGERGLSRNLAFAPGDDEETDIQVRGR